MKLERMDEAGNVIGSIDVSIDGVPVAIARMERDDFRDQVERMAQTILNYRGMVAQLVQDVREDAPDADDLIADAECPLTAHDRECVG